MSQQKTVLITGCSDGGIGSALAKAFQAHGLRVFATARTLSKMASLQELPRVSLLALDVTSSASIAAAVDAVKKETNGSLDYLVNNAAINQYSPILDIDIDKAKKMFDTNYWGALEVIQRLSPLLISGKGTIVSISSISAHANIPYCGALAGSKRSLEILMDTLRVELKPFGVNILSVVNGVVRSNAQNWRHFEDWKLPEDSIYKPLEQLISQRIQEKDGVYNDGVIRSDTTLHAQKLVSKVLAGTTGSIWIGSQAGAVKFATRYLPQFLLTNTDAHVQAHSAGDNNVSRDENYGVNATLNNGAVIVPCTGCYDNEAAAHIGGLSAWFLDVPSQLKFSELTTVQVMFRNGNSTDRYANVTVNDGSAQEIEFLPSSSPGRACHSATLEAKSDTAVIITTTDGMYGPDIDMLIVPEQ